jgi:hypothetical protein
VMVVKAIVAQSQLSSLRQHLQALHLLAQWMTTFRFDCFTSCHLTA